MRVVSVWKAEYQDVAHQPHVLADVLRQAVGRAGDVRLVERGAPALELAGLAGRFDALLDFANTGRDIRPTCAGPSC